MEPVGSPQHPEISIPKSRIFQTYDKGLRKTKIICTIGYINSLILKSIFLALQVVVLKCLSKC